MVETYEIQSFPASEDILKQLRISLGIVLKRGDSQEKRSALQRYEEFHPSQPGKRQAG
jgi:hypothetical protein